MRLVLLLLLLANLVFFAWVKFLAPQGSAEGHLVEQQINRDAIRLLGPAQVAALTVARKDAAKSTACIEWGAINTTDVSKAEAALADLVPAGRVSQRRVDETAKFWVFMPFQPTRQAAQQKAGELRRLGVQELFLVQDEAKARFSISLGVFRSEEAARSRLDELRKQGVRTALVGPRDTPVQRVYLQIRDVNEALAAKLNDIKQGFLGSEVKECAVNAGPAAAQPSTQPAAPAAAVPSPAPAPAAAAAKAGAKVGAKVDENAR